MPQLCVRSIMWSQGSTTAVCQPCTHTKEGEGQMKLLTFCTGQRITHTGIALEHAIEQGAERISSAPFLFTRHP